MAPKAKKGKKANDDWDDGLGETVDPIAQAEQDAKAAEAAAGDEEEEAGGGGVSAWPRRAARQWEGGQGARASPIGAR